VVSVYLGIEPDATARRVARTKADSLIHELRPRSNDQSLPHDARVSLRQDIARIESLFARELVKPGGVAIFACSGAGLFEVVWLPRPVRDRVTVQETTWVRPLLAVLDEYHRLLVAVVDRETADLWEFYLGEHREVGRLRGPDLRERGVAGRRGKSDPHGTNKADLLTKQHFEQIAKALDRSFREGRHDVMAVGGHEHELPRFIESLPQQLRDRLIGTFAIDPSTATAGTVQEQADAVLNRYERELEHTWVSEALERAASGGLAALGVEQCLWAASVAAVDTLLVQDRATAPGVVCDESHWLSLDGKTCPVCGRSTRKVPDVIEELVETVVAEGGSIHHVQAETEMRKHMTAALLRFALPAQPQDADRATSGNRETG
jgi:peptide chain release factor subunit 1